MKKAKHMTAYGPEGSDLLADFRELSEELCQDLASNGISFRPYDDPSLKLFSQLPTQHQLLTLSTLQVNREVRNEMKAEGESLLSTKRLLWRTLNRIGLRHRSDLLDRIEDEDVVEAYTPDFFQIFRNLQSFRFLSCTFEELVSMPVSQLARFPDDTMVFISGIMAKLKKGEITETYSPGHPIYTLEEIVGIHRHVFSVQVRFLSPLYADGKAAAIVSINRGRFISRG